MDRTHKCSSFCSVYLFWFRKLQFCLRFSSFLDKNGHNMYVCAIYHVSTKYNFISGKSRLYGNECIKNWTFIRFWKEKLYLGMIILETSPFFNYEQRLWLQIHILTTVNSVWTRWTQHLSLRLYLPLLSAGFVALAPVRHPNNLFFSVVNSLNLC